MVVVGFRSFDWCNRKYKPIIMNILFSNKQIIDKEILHSFNGIINPTMSTYDNMSVFLCGDISKFNIESFKGAKRIVVLIEESINVDKMYDTISNGQVPLSVGNGNGVYFRKYFNDDTMFDRIKNEHEFQDLGLGKLPGKAFRQGVYITPINEDKNGDLNFKLLRCSTNLSGPTEQCRATDYQIIGSLNNEAENVYNNPTTMNHVLAQIYWNTGTNKARINKHSDKTKDMPKDSMMAFCTFYDNSFFIDTKLKQHGFDWCFGKKNVTALSKLCFKIKNKEDGEDFTVTLYPGSVLFIPIKTNRLYTHEIHVSDLDVKNIPTRMGYVIRCSNTDAVFKDNNTFIKYDGELIKLENETDNGIELLKSMYMIENKTTNIVDYENKFYFSLNKGDYMRPNFDPRGKFLKYDMSTCEIGTMEVNEKICNGRHGKIFVKESNGEIPIVRTTTRYNERAHYFTPQCNNITKEACKIHPQFIFNNIMVEKYDKEYKRMRYHSDQSQDLAPDSFIALYTTYDDSNNSNRKLQIQCKQTGKTFYILLEDKSMVVWTLETNAKYRHKIIPCNNLDNVCHTMTLRNSKTFVSYVDNRCIMVSSMKELLLANDNEKNNIITLKGIENKEIMTSGYPSYNYTLSPSDMLKPITNP